ncbi:hypothetical protein ASE01_15220 [Nocardioides sp. Root190]|uniref:FAD-dependent oxidoreductase n=1 Tax=Nocardioides sp. Root190 TaxID=1736488 RepID=UPI0006F61D61|nr:FAD-dependent oxidoreductase [Nocardioides sp. Root190]KRB76346.1 hypothetical protein ASE01_15220 [Nocardioides sp. Root190]
MSPTSWERAPAPPRPPIEGRASDVVVIGGGITGLCTGLLLARAGKQVVLLEADRIGALASGRNTGKVSLLQGTKLSRLLDHHPRAVAAAYVEANREGVDWLARFCEDHGVAHERRDAYTFAATEEEVHPARAELRAALELGVPVTWRDELDVPFEVHGAVALADQVQLDPLAVVAALAAELERHGGLIAEDSRVVDVSWGADPVVRTADGRVFEAPHVVLATGTPVLDRGLYFAKLEPRRSYLLAHRWPGEMPGMMLSAGSTARSLRDAPGGTLLVGGAGHVVGRGGSEREGLDALRAWAATAFPDAVETHAWSAQDYTSHDGIPYVGGFPRGFGRIHVATGYDKWGLSNGVSAALRIAGRVLGSRPAWARPLERRLTRPSTAATLVRRNMETGVVASAALARAVSHPVSVEDAPDGGDVGRVGIDPRPVGVADGCAVRAICTHLGGTLRWNDAERSWDCPLHGSRFTEAGDVIEGPAVRPLSPADQ